MYFKRVCIVYMYVYTHLHSCAFMKNFKNAQTQLGYTKNAHVLLCRSLRSSSALCRVARIVTVVTCSAALPHHMQTTTN